jgi:hypothetical protein
MTGLSAYTQTEVTAINAVSIANNAIAASATQDNTANLDLWMDVELQVTFATAPTAGTSLSLYLVNSLDGTNVGDEPTPPPATNLVATFPVQAVTTAQRIEYRGIALSPSKYQLVLYNNGTGQTANPTTLVYRTYKVQ